MSEHSTAVEDDALFVSRLVATGSVVLVASAARTGVRCVQLATERAPGLLGLARAAASGDDGAGTARATLRDEVLALVREMAETSWHEARRAIDDFDAYTRADGPLSEIARPYRVKP